jgi:transcriptional regulator EpsA
MQIRPDELAQHRAPHLSVEPSDTAQSPGLGAIEDSAVEGAEALSVTQLESLMLNLEASLRVHTRAHFFSWTQGLLQSLIRHEVLICVLGDGKPLSFRVDSFSTSVADPTTLGEMFLRDAAVPANLITAWAGRFRPVLCEAGNDGPLARGALGRELERIGTTRLYAHGTHDAEGQMTSFFVFASVPATVGSSQAYLLQLAVPFLHSAWVRTKVAVRAQTDDAPKPTTGARITSREREILRWIYLGKSNPEIGAILNVSTFTAKNHVQKILRKLNVVNRAQAVGKALELRILNP